MPASKITYADQVDNVGATEDGRWTSDNADEVRSVVNEHADDIDSIEADLANHGALSLKDTIDSASLIGDDVISEAKLDSAARVKLNSGADTGALLARANHTGTQPASTISDLDSAVSANADVAANKTKLAGIEASATQNSSDASLRARSSHTGTQDLSTISDSGILAGLDSVESEHIEDDAVTIDKLADEYTVNVANKTLAAAVDPSRYSCVFVSGPAGGMYEKTVSDISSLVALDTTKAVAIAFSSDATGASGGWVRPIGSSLSVLWFGAVGDGTTDDSAAFQAAIDLIPDSRLIGNADGTVSINVPSLTTDYDIARYRIATQLTIPDRAAVSLESDGAIGSTLINATGTNYIITDTNTSSGARRIFKGLSFHSGGILIPDRARGLVLIERCAFYQTPTYGVHLQNDDAGLGPVNVKVYDCIFNECLGGINVDASTYLLYHIRGCRFMEQRGSSIEINGPGGTIEDCDFQGCENATDTHIWFRGAPANSADNNATSWRVRDCRFGNEVYNKLGTDYDVPGSAITLGESGQSPVVGVITIEGNHFRGRAGGGTATNGTHLLRCYQRPSAVKLINNNISYTEFFGAVVRQDWIADLNALTHDDLITENEFSGNDRLNRMESQVYYPFDNGDGVATKNGIGWSFDPRTWKESAIVLERNDRVSCSSDHSIVGGEDNFTVCLKVGVPSTRPLVDNSLFGASSSRNYIYIDPDGILNAQLRTLSPAVSQMQAAEALPLVPSRAPFLVKLEWDGTLGAADFYYSFSADFEGADWISLGSDSTSVATLSPLNAATQFFIGYRSSVSAVESEGEGDFYALEATVSGVKVLDWRATIQREVQATNYDSLTGEKWTADTDLRFVDAKNLAASDIDIALGSATGKNKPVSAHYESLFEADGSTYSARLLLDIRLSAISVGDVISWESRLPASAYSDNSTHGGNSGVIKASGTGTADGASIFDVGSMQLHATFPGGVVSVWQCGAIGDNVADDRDEVQLAADLAVSLGKTLHFESAKCAIAGSVTLPGNCAVDAYPEASLRQTSALASCLRIHAPVTKASVRNLSFIGKGDDYTSASDSLVASAIDINGAFNVTVDNITTASFVGCGVRVRGSSSFISIGNSKLIGAGSPEIPDGIGFGASVHIDVCSKVYVYDCELSGHAQGLLTGGGSSDIHAKNLFIHDIPGQHGVYFGDLSNSTLDNIYVDGTYHQGVKVQRSDSLTDLVDDIYCSNLVIRNTGSHGFLVVVPGNGASGGVINRCSGHNIQTFDSGEDGIQISDVIDGQWRLLKSQRAAKSAFRTERIQNCEIADLSAADAQQNGLSVLDSVDVEFDGIKLENVALEDLAASQFGVRITGASSEIKINKLETSADDTTLMRYAYYCSATGTGQESCALTNSKLFGASDFAARLNNSQGFGEWRGNSQDKGYATTIFPVGDYIKGDLTTERVPWADSNRNLYHKVTKSGLSYDLLPGGDPRQDPEVNAGPDWSDPVAGSVRYAGGLGYIVSDNKAVDLGPTADTTERDALSPATDSAYSLVGSTATYHLWDGTSWTDTASASEPVVPGDSSAPIVQGEHSKYSNWIIASRDVADIKYWHNKSSDWAPAFSKAIAEGQHTIKIDPGADILCESAINVGDVPQTTPIRIFGEGALVRHSSPEGLFVGNRLQSSVIKLREIRSNSASSEHVFNQIGNIVCANIGIHTVDLAQSPNASFIFGRDAEFSGGSGFDSGMYSTMVAVQYIRGATTGSVGAAGAPFIDFQRELSAFRANVIDFGYTYGPNDNPAIIVSCFHQGGGRNNGNVYKVRVGENCQGGIITLKGEMDSEVFVRSYDLGTPAADAVVLGSMTALEGETLNGVAGGTYTVDGGNCKSIDIDYNRQSGPISPFYDISLGDSDKTFIRAPGHNSGDGSQRVNLNSRSSYSINNQFTSFFNEDAETHRNLDPEPKAEIDEDFAKVLILDASGEVTVDADETHPVLVRKVDTEASSAADDLEKINGGATGQMIIIGSVANGRDVTVKSNTALRMNGAVDFVLNRVQDRIMMVCETPDNWIEISRSSALD